MQNLRAFNKLFLFLDTLIVVINSGFALLVGASSLLLIINSTYLALALVFDRKTVFQKEKIHFLLFFTGFMLLTFLITRDTVGALEYIRYAVLLFTALYISCKYTTEELISGFCKLMRGTAVISCLFFIMVYFFQDLPYVILPNAYGINYYTCILGNIVVVEGVFRNSGPFWEGGMYAALSALWLVFEIIVFPNRKNKNWIVPLGFYTIYTTRSTSGYAYMMVLLVLLFSHNTAGKRKLWQNAIFIFFGAALFVGISLYETVLDSLVRHDAMVFGKLATQNASYNDRLYGPLLDFWICVQNVFGVGIGNVTEQTLIYGARIFKVLLTSRTSTLTFFFAVFGVIPGLYVNWQWIKFWLHMVPDRLEKTIVILLFILLCTSTPLNDNMIFWLILFAGTNINKLNPVEGKLA